VQLPFERRFVGAFVQTLPHLAIFAVMLLALAPQSFAFWECEGQKCGVSAWECCCAQPDDDHCGKEESHFTRGEHAAETGPCAQDCHCTKVVQDSNPDISRTSFAYTAPLLYVVPATFTLTFDAPLSTEITRSSIPRGPPPSSVFLASVSLRGPPVA
jgi:hypothetical protein